MRSLLAMMPPFFTKVAYMSAQENYVFDAEFSIKEQTRDGSENPSVAILAQAKAIDCIPTMHQCFVP